MLLQYQEPAVGLNRDLQLVMKLQEVINRPIMVFGDVIQPNAVCILG